MGRHRTLGLRLGLTAITLSIIFTFFGGSLKAAPTDYSQTATAYQNFLPLFFTHFIGVVPDPGVTDDAFFFSTIAVPDDNGGDPDRDDSGPPPPTNLFRRNPQVNTWSNNLLLTLELIFDFSNDSVDAITSFLPLWGGPNYVGGVLQNINQVPLGFGIYPLAVEMGGNGPLLQEVGSAFTLPMLSEASLPLVSFPTSLNDFKPGFFPGLPINEWHHSAPFPMNSDNPGFIIGGTAEGDGGNIDTEIALVFGVSVDLNGTGGFPIPPKVIHDFGAAPDDEPRSAVTPLMADFDGDNCVDLAVLLDLVDDMENDLLYTLRGDCSGSFVAVDPVQHDLGVNDAILDLAAYDADNDGVSDLVISFTAPGNGPTPDQFNPGRLDYVFDPLGSFEVVAGPILPSGLHPVFAKATDCDQEQNRDDLVVTGLEFFEAPIDLGDIPPLTPSDVLCFLDGGDESTVVYPKEKSALNVPSLAGGRFIPAIIAASQVGTMGCGQGWTGVAFYILDDDSDGASLPSGVNQILMAEFSDCPGEATGGGAEVDDFAAGKFSGSGCLGSLNPGQPSEGALFYLILGGLFLAVLIGRRWSAQKFAKQGKGL